MLRLLYSDPIAIHQVCVCLRINSFRRVLLPCHIRPRPLRLAALPVIPWETGAPHGTGPLPLRRRGTAALGLVGSYCHVTSHVWHTFHANQLHGDRPTRKVAQLFTSIQFSSVFGRVHGPFHLGRLSTPGAALQPLDQPTSATVSFLILSSSYFVCHGLTPGLQYATRIVAQSKPHSCT